MFTRPEPNMGTPAWKARAAVAALALALLGACSSLGLGDDEADAQAVAEARRCPAVEFVRGAEEVTLFREGAGRDLTDVTSRAVLADYAGGCRSGEGRVEVDLKLVLAAEKGPALQGPGAGYRYFVAVADPEGGIIAKQEFDTSVSFPQAQRRAGSIEELTQTIPVADGARPGDYRILIGFQLTPDQLQYNRERRLP
jgi:hypothetical protein